MNDVMHKLKVCNLCDRKINWCGFVHCCVVLLFSCVIAALHLVAKPCNFSE